MRADAGSARPRRLFELSGGALALDFANTWSDRGRPETDQLLDYDDLVDFLVQADLVQSAAERSLRRRAAVEARRARGALERARSLRENLARLFMARAVRRPFDPEDLTALNRALRDAAAHQVLEARGDTVAWAWRDDTRAARLDAPLRPVVRSAAELLTSPDLDRIRVCDGTGCTWLFLDRSRNRSRRWCSMESCGNRAKVRRHYQRQRGE